MQFGAYRQGPRQGLIHCAHGSLRQLQDRHPCPSLSAGSRNPEQPGAGWNLGSLIRNLSLQTYWEGLRTVGGVTSLRRQLFLCLAAQGRREKPFLWFSQAGLQEGTRLEEPGTRQG